MSINSFRGGVIMPTYNNEKTVIRVLEGVLLQIPANQVIVVIDGATDSTRSLLQAYASRIILIDYSENQGKGWALRQGFKKAIELGWDYAVTIDSDGQHFPEDIPGMIEAWKEKPNSVVMGSRNMQQSGVPQKSSFGNKFSNFWFLVETGIQLPDTQTGFRVYPVRHLNKRWFTKKFEFEIEVIVRLAWRWVEFQSQPIQVKYDPQERVSHFRPGRDFFRISVLNSVLVILALLTYYPRKLFRRDTLNKIKQEVIKPQESSHSKALSLGFGVFMGIVPIWGFQLLVGIPLAVLFRMNKLLFIAAANISIPPMIPFIIYGSFLVGQVFVAGEIDATRIFDLRLEAIQTNLKQYLVGACILALAAGLVTYIISFTLLKALRKR